MFCYWLIELHAYCMWLIFGKYVNEMVIRRTSGTQQSLSSVSVSYCGKSYLIHHKSVIVTRFSLYYFWASVLYNLPQGVRETYSVIVVDAFRSFCETDTPTVVYWLVLFPSLEMPR